MSSAVITGLGVISPIGNNIPDFGLNLRNGKSGVKEFKSFDSKDFEHHHAGEVDGYPQDIYEEKGRKIGKVSRFAIDAAKQAITDSGLDLDKIAQNRVAIVIGSTMAGIRVFEDLDATWQVKGLNSVERELIPEVTGYSLTANLSYALNHSGMSIPVINACAAGSTAIIYAKELLEHDVVDYAIAGGADVLSKITLAGFSQMHAVDTICRPFDKDRNGIIVSEGSGMVVMERLETASKRGCHIYGQVMGYGMNSDCYHPTAPNPEGVNMAEAAKKALRHAQITPEKIDYICAHGTGTPANDVAETNGIKKVFGSDAYKIPVSAIKSMIGHAMGASSAIAVVACLVGMKNEFLPPTINYKTPDPECDLDYVPNTSREKKLNCCMVDAFGFGGINTVLVLQKEVRR